MKESTYYYIIRTRRNIGFSRYGDVCETCSACDVAGELKSRAYIRHRAMEQAIRREHQLAALEESLDMHFAMCDKGSVKLLPKVNADFTYYLPRLVLIPMTIHALPSHDSTTFWWTEVEGGKGTSNILTTINKYIQLIPSNVRELRLHFDNCRGENKSQYNV